MGTLNSPGGVYRETPGALQFLVISNPDSLKLNFPVEQSNIGKIYFDKILHHLPLLKRKNAH